MCQTDLCNENDRWKVLREGLEAVCYFNGPGEDIGQGLDE